MLGHKIPKDDLKAVQRIYQKVEGRDERLELNLYITGYDEDVDGADTAPATAATGAGQAGAEQGQPGQTPEGSPSR
jgi:succinate dehydrogenase / fumarate reductase iron-sulfur subunit